MSVVWTSRLAGIPLPERVTGVDLMGRLLEAASAHRLRVYFLGARPEVVAELARRCARDYPGLVVAGFRDGYFGPGDHDGDRRGDPAGRAAHAVRRHAEPVQGDVVRAAPRRPSTSP